MFKSKRAKVSEGKVTTSFELEEVVYNVLRNYSKKSGMTMSAVVNKALKMYLHEKRKQGEFSDAEYEKFFEGTSW